MHALPSFLALAAALPTLLAQAPPAAPFADRFPKLTELSSWSQSVDTRRAGPQPRGAFPVGNGMVCGHFGLADRAATVQGLSGPTYQTDATWAPLGHFGEQSFAVVAAGAPLALPQQRIARVRGANVVITEDRNEAGIALTTVNFTVAGDQHFYRLVQLHNGSGKELAGVELRARVADATVPAPDALRIDLPSEAHPYRAEFRFVADGFVQDGDLVRPFGALPAGATVSTAFVMHTLRRGDSQIWVDPTQAVVERRLADHLAWWQNRLADTTSCQSDPPRVADLVEDWKVLLLVHRSAANGLFTGLVGDRTCRVRDLAGPLLLCLRYHLWNDAKELLQALARATHHYGALREELPLDGVWGPVPAEQARWEQVAIPDGGLGSLVILFHEWYWRASRDTGLLREHLPLLQRCLDGQRFTREGLQPFAGHEAHLRLQQPTLALDLDRGAQWLAHDPAAGRSSLSFDASALYVMANMAMGEVHDALAPPRAPAAVPDTTGPQPAQTAATHIDPVYLRRMIEVARLSEARFWQPTTGRFAPALSPLGLAPHDAPLADCNLRLQWLGWTFASSDKNRLNLRSTLQALWRAPDAVRIGMTPDSGLCSGETQPLLLFALADLDDRGRAGALAELLRMAGPAGSWSSAYDAQGAPLGHGDAPPSHCQPGPGGLAIDAICFALTGVRFTTIPGWDDESEARFRPRLPPDTRSFAIRDLRRDGRHLHLHMEQVLARLGPEELERQEKLLKAGMIEAAAAKDPAREYPRFRYRIEMENPPPDAEHIVCSVNVGRDTLVRYLARSLPSFGDSCDPPEDQQSAYPEPVAAAPVAAAKPSPGAPFTTLLVTARADAARRHRLEPLQQLDAGLPFGVQDFVDRILVAGKPRGQRLVFDVGVLDGGGLVGKPAAFWQQTALQQAIAAFTAAGGQVVRPQFVAAWQAAAPVPATGEQPFASIAGPWLQQHWPGTAGSDVTWRSLDAAPDGRVDLPATERVPMPSARVAATWIDAKAPLRGVLRAGCGQAFQVLVDGNVVLAQAGASRGAADQFEAELELAAGAHQLAVVVADHGSRASFHLRFVGTDGLPIEALAVRRP